MRKYYELLEISEDASESEIKKAYQRMASKYHPDKNVGNETEVTEKFQRVKEAYECLSDPERRVAYDENGDTSTQQGNPSEDLFLHLLNEISDNFETVAEILQKAQSVLEEMIDECADRKVITDSRIFSVQRMIAAVSFKGKGANFVEGVLQAKLKKLQEDRKELEDATNAAKAAWATLKDYEAMDQAPPMDIRQHADMLKRMQVIGGLMQNRFGGASKAGKRKGGMPFSGV